METGGSVYIMTNKTHTVLYVGVTSDLCGRIYEHKNKIYPKSFSARYNTVKLVYHNFFSTIMEAIDEEKRIKGGSRAAKIKLINEMNSEWRDLEQDVIEG